MNNAIEQDNFDDAQKEEKIDDKFRDGDSLTFVRVRFPGNAKSFPFLVGKRKFAYGQKVLAMSDRGMTVGYINSFPYSRPFHSSMRPLRSISKTATAEDIKQQQEYTNQVKKAERSCLELIDRLRLDMTLTHVEIIHFGKKAVFYFMAPERVDFRDLVKSLVSDLKMRIELRQISLRDRTAALGGIGACGLQTCCSSFLQNYGNVTIKMAKNQNLALIPSKVNGICGQLKCCIKYEDDVYQEKRSKLPREGDFIHTFNGDFGRVTRLHLIIEQFEMLTSEGQRRLYTSGQYNPHYSGPSKKYPDQFENIIDETSKIIADPLPLLSEKKDGPISDLDDLDDLNDENQNEVQEVSEISVAIKLEEEFEMGQGLMTEEDEEKKQREEEIKERKKNRFERQQQRNHHSGKKNK